MRGTLQVYTVFDGDYLKYVRKLSLTDFRLSVCPPLFWLLPTPLLHSSVNGRSKKNDANQANTYVQIILKKLWHAVIVFVQVRDALLGLLNLINAHSSKLRKPKLAKLSSREIPTEGPRPNQRAFEEQRTVNLRVRETSSLSLTVLLVVLTTLLGHWHSGLNHRKKVDDLWLWKYGMIYTKYGLIISIL